MLGFDIQFADLYRREGLVSLDKIFLEELKASDEGLWQQLLAARAEPESLDRKAESELLIALGGHVEDFIGKLFKIESDIQLLADRHHALAALYSTKRLFVQRKAGKGVSAEALAGIDAAAAQKKLEDWFGETLTELTFARFVRDWMADETANEEKLNTAKDYAAWALLSDEGIAKHGKGILFRQPRKLDPEHLVHTETEERDGVTVLRLGKNHIRQREGFALTDAGGSLEQALDEANYCIFCHNQGRDSCSKGMREKTGEFKKSPLDIPLNGCPLEEKISEMHTLKAQGVSVGALAMVTVDNPMCAGTGHRICNDCMKSCIYQKQDPVNIPLAETRTLFDVLELPYGFEIYSLLTRWNPLNIKRPLPKSETGRKVLVSGLGPAGYTLSHHLLNDGHTVVAIDGLKIEPLPEQISGVGVLGERQTFQPIKDIAMLFEPLDARTLAGFGGVAEYGITVRWNKNYLKVIRLLLERRHEFALIGGVRFGGTLTYETAFDFGFDHIALCMGAGKPTVLNIPGSVARGVRTASDFLMSLQLTGAAKKDSIANLQLRLPAVVIGGGLTAIDTATEALAYYPVQVEKFLARYDTLVSMKGEAAVRQRWSKEETIVAEEFIAHAKAIRAEREKAKAEKREADIFSLLDSWGGVKLIYRKRMIDAPSYRLNHEEVEKALEEGIFFTELYEPAEVKLDEFGHAKELVLKQAGADKQVSVPARAVLVAAGTSPNTVLHREDPLHYHLDGKYFQAVDESGNKVTPERNAKPTDVRVLMAVEKDGRTVSFFGDLHPSFAGNVVKAMGSAKQGYPVVSRALMNREPSAEKGADFIARANEALRAVVEEVRVLTPTIVEIVVRAPLAAKAFEPGQFYRLQNFERFAPKIDVAGRETTLQMEGLALTGAWVDKDKGLLSTIVLEMGGSSDLCRYLKPGEPVILMGPTGTPTEIEKNETVLLAGGGLGNAVLFSIGRAFRAAGSKVLYFAGYRQMADRYKVEEIEQAADEIIWCSDEGAFAPGRAQDKTFHGNIVEAMRAYASGELGKPGIPLSEVDRIIAIGSDRMMAAVGAARHGVLKPYLKEKHEAIGSINSPMQCMMKEICAQCLQKHVDPKTGKEFYVYSCFNQDQCLDEVSFEHLNDRLKQNGLQEKITAQWIDVCLRQLALRKEAA